MAIVLDGPREEWAARGLALAARLRHDLGPVAVRVEHIGSTSIPAMPAKPVIDLQVSVADLDADLDGPLTALGLSRLPYERDHVPAGRSDDPARWAKRMWGGPDVNLHVRLAGSPNERWTPSAGRWSPAAPEFCCCSCLPSIDRNRNLATSRAMFPASERMVGNILMLQSG